MNIKEYLDESTESAKIYKVLKYMDKIDTDFGTKVANLHQRLNKIDADTEDISDLVEIALNNVRLATKKLNDIFKKAK